MKHSEETKRKIGMANKGKLIGRHLSDETKLKIGIATRGKKLSGDTKRKLSEIHKRQFCLRGHDTYKVGRTGSNCDMCQYIRNAHKRGLLFALTEEQFVQVIAQKCMYECSECNKTGIDRIDSFRGYTLDNVQPMCFNHNRMKTIFSTGLFESLSEGVYLNKTEIPTLCLPLTTSILEI